ncbi:MAG: hypothetical protein M3521_13125 [Acidobacteriota bacterium]|jgi:hypothetical protein|nr:hypothetical protein [Acidobacteriota bacterium]
MALIIKQEFTKPTANPAATDNEFAEILVSYYNPKRKALSCSRTKGFDI